MINNNKYFIKNGKSMRPIRVKKNTGLNEMSALYMFVFFFSYTATRANQTGLTEYLTHLNKITANMSVTLKHT